MNFSPFFQRNGLSGQENHQKWYFELNLSVFRCQSWKIEKITILRDFRPNLTNFEDDEKQARLHIPNGHLWSKSIVSWSKLYISVLKHPYFVKKPSKILRFLVLKVAPSNEMCLYQVKIRFAAKYHVSIPQRSTAGHA